ncbi:MAG: RloB domain-containing protein [Bacteroidales bacterium]|nr:RloB domain-containing protein [Bacteroidales bacterium]
MIQRRRDYGKKNPSRDAHKVYIVCEGRKTEPSYFAFFEGLSSNLQVITIPPTTGTDPLKLLERAKQVFIDDDRVHSVDYTHGDTVWFVIDTDTWETEGKITPLRKFCDTQNKSITKEFDEIKQYSAWNVAQSNPCFEIWLYYHLMETPPEDYAPQKERFKTYFDKVLPGGFDYDRHPKYLAEAINNAKTNFKRDEDKKLALFSTEMFLLGTEILGFVKRDLDTLKNKLA